MSQSPLQPFFAWNVYLSCTDGVHFRGTVQTAKPSRTAAFSRAIGHGLISVHATRQSVRIDPKPPLCPACHLAMALKRPVPAEAEMWLCPAAGAGHPVYTYTPAEDWP